MKTRQRLGLRVLFLGLWSTLLTASVNAQVDSDAIMGFESPSAWMVRGERAIRTTVSATTIRTQGSLALAVTNPGEEIELTSLPVASHAKALAGVGDAGAFFEVDVMLPTQPTERDNKGSLQLFISCPSRRLH